MAANNVFHVVAADALDAVRDVFLGLPVDGNNKMQAFHRIPLRSSLTETDDDRRVRVQLVSPNVVQSTQGLRRLLLQFPQAYVPGIKRHRNDRDGGDAGGGGAAGGGNCTMGFALFDHRSGPTETEQRVMANIDRLAAFVRRTMFGCERIRTTLKLGPAAMSPEQQQVAADMMDLHVARPQTVEAHGRYCYAKLVLPDSNAHEMFHTYFWTPDGTRIPADVVEGYRNFQAVPFVEIEDVFVSKAVRSLQLKLRECIVCPRGGPAAAGLRHRPQAGSAPGRHPPLERPNARLSVCFPSRVCSATCGSETVAPPAPPVATTAAVVAAPSSPPAAAAAPTVAGPTAPAAAAPLSVPILADDEEAEAEAQPAKRARDDDPADGGEEPQEGNGDEDPPQPPAAVEAEGEDGEDGSGGRARSAAKKARKAR